MCMWLHTLKKGIFVWIVRSTHTRATPRARSGGAAGPSVMAWAKGNEQAGVTSAADATRTRRQAAAFKDRSQVIWRDVSCNGSCNLPCNVPCDVSCNVPCDVIAAACKERSRAGR